MVKGIVDLYRRAYSGLPREAWFLFAVNLVNSSGAMVIFFLSLYLTRRLGFTPAQAGQALSLYGLGSLLGAYVGGWLSDRIGSTSVQKISLFLSGGFLIVLGQVRSAAALLPLLFGYSVAAGALYPANAASMARICPPELQVKGFALNRLANNLGVTIGPAVVGLLALREYRLLFWADGLTCLAAAALFMIIWRKPEAQLRAVEKKRERQKGAARGPWRDVPFLMLMILVIAWGAVFVQIFATFPLYMREIYGIDEDQIGRLLAVNTILIVTLEMALMERIRPYPKTRMINLSFLLLGLGFWADAPGPRLSLWRFYCRRLDVRRNPEHAPSDRSHRRPGRARNPRPVYGNFQFFLLPGADHRPGRGLGRLRRSQRRGAVVRLCGCHYLAGRRFFFPEEIVGISLTPDRMADRRRTMKAPASFRREGENYGGSILKL